MKVKNFIKLYSHSDNINVELHEINENVEWHTDIDALRTDDGLHEEWKNAEIEGWYIICDDIISFRVIK